MNKFDEIIQGLEAEREYYDRMSPGLAAHVKDTQAMNDRWARASELVACPGSSLRSGHILRTSTSIVMTGAACAIPSRS
jgi:hypothetical protein